MNIPGPNEVINALRMTGQNAFADEFEALMAKPAEQPRAKPAPLPVSVGGVKTFGVVPDPVYGRDKFGPTCPDTEGPLYVPLSDYQALRDELGEAKGEYDRSANKVAALRDQLAERETSEAVGSGPWQPLTAPGQIQVGDWLSFMVSGRFICAPVRLVIDAGTDREEVVYNRGKNHYFVTSMAVDGTSTHKGVLVAKPRA